MDARARAQELYRLALDNADWNPQTLTEHRGWSGSELAGALQLLGELGLLVPSSGHHNGWTALAPDTALRKLLHDEEQHTEALLSAVRQTRSALAQVLADFQPVYARELASVQMEVVNGMANVSAVLEDASRRAEEEVLSLHPGRPLPAEMVEAGLERDRLVLGRGVRMRTIHLRSAASAPHMTAYLRRLNGAGAQVRTAHTLPMRLIVVDGSLAIVPASRTADGEIAAIVLRGETLAGVFRGIFQHSWESATVLTESATDSPEGDWRPTGRHRELVRMLGGGLTDEAMARKLGVSERTVRRLVSELTERLGTASRFQAGVCAVRLGWLDD